MSRVERQKEVERGESVHLPHETFLRGIVCRIAEKWIAGSRQYSTDARPPAAFR